MPQQYLRLTCLHRRANRMGVLVSADSTEVATDLEFLELALGDELRAVIAIVRIPRSEMPAEADRIKDAARQLL